MFLALQGIGVDIRKRHTSARDEFFLVSALPRDGIVVVTQQCRQLVEAFVADFCTAALGGYPGFH